MTPTDDPARLRLRKSGDFFTMHSNVFQVASVTMVTEDESDSGPTAANYDAHQHLHTHTLTV